MTAPTPTRILTIATAVVPGRERSYVNVYGLDEQSRVWQWNAKDAKWVPHKVPERAASGGGF
jgi:hypothetical protein